MVVLIKIRSVRLSQFSDNDHGIDGPPVGHMGAGQHRERPARAALMANVGIRVGDRLQQQPRCETRQQRIRRQVIDMKIAFFSFLPRLSQSEESCQQVVLGGEQDPENSVKLFLQDRHSASVPRGKLNVGSKRSNTAFLRLF